MTKTLNTLAEYGHAFQLKVLGALLSDKDFLQTVHDILTRDQFNTPAHQWTIDTILRYWENFHTVPTLEDIVVEIKKEENEVLRTSIQQEVKAAYKYAESDLQYAMEEFISFCKNQAVKNALLESVDLLATGEYDAITSIMDKALKAGFDRNIGHEYVKDVEERYREDNRPTIPTPWLELNTLLQGGFGPGDLGIVFGNPGGGKSWLMVALAGFAARAGYRVNYYTLELGEGYVGKRFDCYLSGYSIDEIAKHRAEVEQMIKNLNGSIIIKEYPPKSASINTIKAHVKKCGDQDQKPDLIIIDYLDYLRQNSKYGKNSERKEQIDDVYIAAKGLAKELQVPVLSPSQVNRAGAKDNIIEGDKAAGSYDKIMVADFCMSLSRKKEDKINNTGRIHIMKNRYGMDGMTFGVNMNTDNGHIEFTEDIPIYESGEGQGGDSSFKLTNGMKERVSQKLLHLTN